MPSLSAKIQARGAHVVVCGLGYVGSPLALELARAGFHVTGLDTDALVGHAGAREHVHGL